MRIVPLLAASLLLGACSPSPTPPASMPAPRAAASAAPVKTPWDNLVKDEDKAKAVQQKVDDYARRQQQAIEAQGG